MASTPADEEAIAGAKQVLRRAVQLRRESRSPQQRTRDDEARLTVVDAAIAGRLPGTVAAYLSAGVEPGTLQLLGWLAAHRVRVLLPVLSHGPTPAWAPYAGPDALQVGRHGILEPSSKPLPAEALAQAQLVLAPALAANENGDRLGRGGGWYDRALVHARPDALLVAVVHDEELLDALPAEPHDRPVRAVVTPSLGWLDLPAR